MWEGTKVYSTPQVIHNYVHYMFKTFMIRNVLIDEHLHRGMASTSSSSAGKGCMCRPRAAREWMYSSKEDGYWTARYLVFRLWYPGYSSTLWYTVYKVRYDIGTQKLRYDTSIIQDHNIPTEVLPKWCKCAYFFQPPKCTICCQTWWTS